MLPFSRTTIRQKQAEKHGIPVCQGTFIKDAGSTPLSGWRYRHYELHANRWLSYYERHQLKGETFKGELELRYCYLNDITNPIKWAEMRKASGFHKFTGK